uniref:L-olivosyl-oleandolide 3-O-methyltransferase n=1 Tax=Streptomyces antibioticus TaxID=1890 RepID=OLEY_STRAT|nr:RecName: Full=L-olivosyl-oleandolide 3-O-methyltransferase; AltName: Full=Oleandomycin biosynthesis protein Y [Streptomyces antibioticus]CAA05644.1 oleY [Streptomyces antibioticus]
MSYDDHAVLEAILRCAGGDERFLLNTVEEWGAAEITAALVDELLFRCEIPQVGGEAFIGLDVLHGADRISHVLQVTDGKPVTSAEPAGQELGGRTWSSRSATLLRELFGPPSGRTAGGFGVSFLPDLRGPRTMEGAALAARATNVVLHATTNETPPLDRLALRYESDKWGGVHWFTGHYDRHLRAVRDQAVRILEIGIGGYDDLLPSGASLKMWKRYFPRGLVFGVDIFDSRRATSRVSRRSAARQDDPEFMRRVAEEHGPFDVIIDDGSHINAHMRTSFSVMFPHLRNGGFYVIEDTFTSYWPGYGGPSGARCPSGTTALEMVKGLIDSVHYEERPDGAATADYIARNLVGLHAYQTTSSSSRRAINKEGGIPHTVPREPFWNDN